MGSFGLPALSIRPPDVPNPLETYGRLLSLKSLLGGQQLQQQEIQQQTAQTQMTQIELQRAQAMQRAMRDSGGDLNKFQDLSLQYGAGPKAATFIVDLKSKMADLDKTTLANHAERNNQALGHLQPILDAPEAERPAMWDEAVKAATSDGTLGPDEAAKFQIPYPGDTAATTMLNGLKLGSTLFDEQLKKQEQTTKLPGEKSEALQKQLSLLGQTMAGAQNQQQWDARLNYLKNQGLDESTLALAGTEYSPQAVENAKQLALTPAQQATLPVEKLSMADYIKKHPITNGHPTGPNDYVNYEKTLPIEYRYNLPLSGGGAPGAGGPGGAPQVTPAPGVSNLPAYQKLSPIQRSTIDQAAQRFAETGQLPAGQRGVNAYTMMIQNRAAELYPGNIAANSAAYKSNQKSLENITDTLNKLQAFESAGGKNLDMFLDQAKSIIDTGSPWLNTPLRSVSEKGLGSADLAAINTARTVALREIARVTNDPKLSGQLSDSAREEVENLIPQNATYAQIVRVAGILRQDMKNVEDGLANQQQFISRRLQQPSGENPPPAGGGSKVLSPAEWLAQHNKKPGG